MTLRPIIRLTQYRGNVLTVAPATEPVTLAEVKGALVISDTGQDAYLTSLLEEARQEVEEVTGLALITQTWRLSLDHWPNGVEQWWDGVRQAAISELYAAGVRPWVPIPRYPLRTIASVTVFDQAGNDTAVTVADVFDVDTYQRPGRMALKSGATWPIALRDTNAIQIDYTAGYGAAVDVPAPIKRAIRQMACYMYEHRGDGCEPKDAYQASGAAAIMGRYEVKAI